VFWTGDLPLSDLNAPIRNRLHGPKQIADAYLLTLAMNHWAKPVTFDSRMRPLAPIDSAEYESLVILQP